MVVDWIPLLSLKVQRRVLLWARNSLTFRQTIDSGFTLKLVPVIMITYSQMHCTDKYSQRSLIIEVVWLNHLSVVDSKLLWIWIPLLPLKLQIKHLLQANKSLTFRQTIKRGLTLKVICDMMINYSQMHHTDKYS